MFDKCDFLLGRDDTVIIVVPACLPKAETYTVTVDSSRIRFRAGQDTLAELAYQGGEIYRRIANNVQVGLVEFPQDGQPFPEHITHLAYVEVRRSL